MSQKKGYFKLDHQPPSQQLDILQGENNLIFAQINFISLDLSDSNIIIELPINFSACQIFGALEENLKKKFDLLIS